MWSMPFFILKFYHRLVMMLWLAALTTHFYFLTNSTLRFSFLPASVVLEAIGAKGPTPSANSLCAAIPCVVCNLSFMAFALSNDNLLFI